MLAKVMSCAIVGIDAEIVEVEVDVNWGMPFFALVGLPDAAIRESRDRVRSAIKNSGLKFPYDDRITVNLAPADLRKEGPAYDLPIAVGILAASRQLWPDQLEGAVFIGELSLDGGLRPIKGGLLIADLAREKGFKRVYISEANATEAALIPDLEVYAVSSLSDLVGHLTGLNRLEPVQLDMSCLSNQELQGVTDFSDIMGQEHVKRALEVAASGGHNILLSGSPGTGKTLLARALPGIMPDMDLDEALDVTKVYSVAGLLPADIPLIYQRPFRAPHHTISYAGLVGGGAWPRPGEISLAHRGVLFLDELPEFNGRLIDLLRQPLEGHPREVVISRAAGTVSYPANFMLVAAQNPCPCGYYGDPIHNCNCRQSAVVRYQKKLSGPLLDRIDLHVEVPRVEFDKLVGQKKLECSARVRERVTGATQIQSDRFRTEGIRRNSEMGNREIRTYCPIDEAGQKLMKSAMAQMGLSARAFHRLLKIARTIADLAQADRIETIHIAEALQYRPKGI